VARLELPTVTLCAATSVNVGATLAAISASTDQVLFGDVALFTDAAGIKLPQDGRVVEIAPLRSGKAYSEFMLHRLADHIRTDHCLVIQWDGFVVDARQWQDRFLDFDYVGATWPQFSDGRNVGNGGFSLRSRKLLEACRSAGFAQSHPEDVSIARVNRDFLEREHGIAFADPQTADRFALERSGSPGRTFGFHGVFNMIPLLGVERFWRLYQRLDDRSTAFHDYRLLMRQLGTEGGAAKRRCELTLDLVTSWAGRAPRVRRKS
jgi:hypothetical protein